MPLKKSAGVNGREREKEGDRKRGGGVQKELWSCRTKKKKKKSKILSQTTQVPNDKCPKRVLNLFGMIQDRGDRERAYYVCVQKYFTSREGLYCRANG